MHCRTRTGKCLGGSNAGSGSAFVSHQVCVLGQVASPFRETQFLHRQSFVGSEADACWELPLSRRIQNYDYKIAGLWKGPRQLSLSFISSAVNRFWLPHQQNRSVNNSNGTGRFRRSNECTIHSGQPSRWDLAGRQL